MNLLTITNLFPRPDAPSRGVYNLRLFAAMARGVADGGGWLHNVCLVPEWQVSRWRRIRGWRWQDGPETEYLPVPYLPVVGRSVNATLYGWGMQPLRSKMNMADVVYAAWLYPDGVAVATLAERMAKPLWLMALGSDTFHLDVPARARQIVAACEYARGIVCVWKGLAERLINAGVDARKVHVIPNGVDAGMFRFRPQPEAGNRLENRCESVISEVITRRAGRPLLLFVGNLVDVKGPDVTVKAVARMKQAWGGEPFPLLVMVGEGTMRSRIERLIHDEGLESDVVLLGARPHDEVALWMNMADCLCLSSRSEGMPNVVLEALASGLPVVATDVGAVREILESERDCRVVAKDDAGGVALAMAGALAATPDRPAISARAHDRYSWDKQARLILELMKNCS